MRQKNDRDKLRRVRVLLGLSLRDVEQASRNLAERLGDPRYHLPAGRMSEIEGGKAGLTIYKLLSLALIYDRPVLEILSLYGIDARKRGDYADLLPSLPTHLADMTPPRSALPLPIRLDPAFSPRQTTLVNRFIQEWREIPLEILDRMRLERSLFVRIGQDDNLMYPLLRAGSLVQVDPGCQEIRLGGWTGDLDRPLYVFSTHRGHRCSWCWLEGQVLTLVPHPGCVLAPETYTLGKNVDLIGRVVGVWSVLTAAPPR